MMGSFSSEQELGGPGPPGHSGCPRRHRAPCPPWCPHSGPHTWVHAHLPNQAASFDAFILKKVQRVSLALSRLLCILPHPPQSGAAEMGLRWG